MLSIYQLPDRFFSVVFAKTDAGFLIASELTASISRQVSDVELGEFIIEQLNKGSNLGILTAPPRDAYAERDRKILAESDCKSWLALHRRAQLCELRQNGNVLQIAPMRNDGTKGSKKGFSPLESKTLTLTVRDATELGLSLRKCFELCE